jgi:hypothetical protein
VPDVGGGAVLRFDRVREPGGEVARLLDDGPDGDEPDGEED